MFCQSDLEGLFHRIKRLKISSDSYKEVCSLCDGKLWCGTGFSVDGHGAIVRTGMLNCKAIGSEMVLAYVLPRYCRERHNVSDERNE